MLPAIPMQLAVPAMVAEMAGCIGISTNVLRLQFAKKIVFTSDVFQQVKSTYVRSGRISLN